jgi:hypothetical protein
VRIVRDEHLVSEEVSLTNRADRRGLFEGLGTLFSENKLVVEILYWVQVRVVYCPYFDEFVSTKFVAAFGAKSST